MPGSSKTFKKTLFSFTGYNDAGALIGQPEGAVYTALNNESFDSAYLLFNPGGSKKPTFEEITERLAKIIKKEKLAKSVTLIPFHLKDVTDHNEVYTRLKEFTDSIEKPDGCYFYAAISSGTPAMQTAWILLAESGEFSEQHPLNLLKVKDPKFGESKNIPVKLEAALPRITALKKEVHSFLPRIDIYIDAGELKIGGQIIPLAPVELCYYRYFCETKKQGREKIKFSGLTTPEEFLKTVYAYHEESFPVLDLGRDELRKMIKSGTGLSAATFRGNISKLNKKIELTLQNEQQAKYCKITATGQRGAKFYGIPAPAEKITIHP